MVSRETGSDYRQRVGKERWVGRRVGSGRGVDRDRRGPKWTSED